MLQVSLLWFDWNMFDIIELKRLLSPMLRCHRCRFELSTVTILHLCAPCASTTSSKVEVTRKCSKSQSMCCQTAHKLTGLKISEDIVSSCWTTKKHQLHPMYSVIQGNLRTFLGFNLLIDRSHSWSRHQWYEGEHKTQKAAGDVDHTKPISFVEMWCSKLKASHCDCRHQRSQNPNYFSILDKLYPANGLGKRVNLLNSVLGSAQSPFFGYFFNKVPFHTHVTSHKQVPFGVIPALKVYLEEAWRSKIWHTHTHSDIPDIYFLWLILKHSRMKFCIYLYRAAFGQFTWHVTWPACSILIANCLAYSCILTHEGPDWGTRLQKSKYPRQAALESVRCSRL